MIECVIPTLKVESIESSIAFYSDVLGFSKDWEYEKDGYSVAGISRDSLSIYLSEGNEGTKEGWIWIGLEDDSLFGSILSSKAKIIQEPKNYSYAYEMRVEDPDGHILQLGTEPRK
ncbi:MAG: glyoxalase superfamily protein [Sphaerochaetaceae bacterium]